MGVGLSVTTTTVTQTTATQDSWSGRDGDWRDSRSRWNEDSSWRDWARRDDDWDGDDGAYSDTSCLAPSAVGVCGAKPRRSSCSSYWFLGREFGTIRGLCSLQISEQIRNKLAKQKLRIRTSANQNKNKSETSRLTNQRAIRNCASEIR